MENIKLVNNKEIIEIADRRSRFYGDSRVGREIRMDTFAAIEEALKRERERTISWLEGFVTDESYLVAEDLEYLKSLV